MMIGVGRPLIPLSETKGVAKSIARLTFGQKVLACCANLLFSEGVCTGLLTLGDLGHFGVSYQEVLFLFEQWAGHRLLSEQVTRPHDREFCSCVKKESNLGRDVASSVTWSKHWLTFLVVLVFF